MEWDSKTCSWNGVSKLETQDNSYNHHHNHHHHHHHLASLGGSNGSGFTNMFSVDLKLGRLEEIGDLSMEESLKQSMSFNMVSSSSSSSSSPALALSRRGRPRNSGSAQNNVFCSVDGCTSDLHQGREYHRRHKVCERHSKTPVVLVGGKEQRFCQQCSRFHSLEEFDEVKRSCRKRLDGHNRRRRKRQPEALYMPDSAGGFLSSHTGDGMLQFCCPQINTGNWATMSQSDTYFRNNQETIYQPLMNGIASTGNKRGGVKVSPDNGSGCALSLLSSYPSQSSGICVGSSMQSTMMSLSSVQGSSTELNLNNNFVQVSLSQGLEYIDNSASISNTTSSVNAHSFGGFHSANLDVFRENGSSSRIFPFGWE